MTAIYKVGLIFCLLIVFSLLAGVVTYKIRLSGAEKQIVQQECIITDLKTQVAKAEASLTSQNMAIAQAKIEIEQKKTELLSEYQRLNKKYELLKKNSAEALGSNPACEAELNAIRKAQEAFLYE